MEDWQTGDFVGSAAGHDMGEIYVVIAVGAGRVLVADGKKRTIRAPKYKNPRHLIRVNWEDRELRERFDAGAAVRDEEIKYAIRLCRSRIRSGPPKPAC